jgi:hypothetical protein
MGIPAVATRQGVGSPIDYPVTAKAAITWITSYRSRLVVTKKPQTTIVNINGPSCGNPLATSDCSSTAGDPPNDVTALGEGFTVVDQVPFVPRHVGLLRVHRSFCARCRCACNVDSTNR